MDSGELSDLHWLLDVIQSADIGIVVLDRQLRVAVFNRFMQAHSGRPPEVVIGEELTGIFPELDAPWLRQRVETVFQLGIPVYSNWQQRPWLFQFPLDLPLHTDQELMFQNTVFLPLQAANARVERVAIVVYDVSAEARNQRQLQRAQEALLAQSRTDGLTGLCNRQYWDLRLQEEFARVRRSAAPASLVMLDIDHFKSINDRHGHPNGDRVIRALAEWLSANCRSVDFCGRYGGEEFALILPDTDSEGAFTFCERLRRQVESERLPLTGGEELTFSISLGVAGFDPAMERAEHWVECADRALYRAKRGGRNRTTVYAP